MKKSFLLPLLLMLALVGCEDNNGIEGYNLLNEEHAKNFSVSSYIYETNCDLPPNIDYDNYVFPPSYKISFADSFRCQCHYWIDKKNIGSNDYYYEINYPYISIYVVSGMYGWKHDKDGNFVVDYFTKDELEIEGIAGVLRFTKDTSEIVVDKSYSDFEFFYQEKPMVISKSEKVKDPNSLFPIPDIQ